VLVEEALDLGDEGELLGGELEVHTAAFPGFLTGRQIVSATIAAVPGAPGSGETPPVSFLDERAGLAGKVAVVAGGGGGLGRASALDLARAGVALALADVDGDALHQTAAEARGHGIEVLESVTDVRDPEAMAGLFEACDRSFGRLDILVNVVGGTFRSAFTDVSAKGRDALSAPTSPGSSTPPSAPPRP